MRNKRTIAAACLVLVLAGACSGGSSGPGPALAVEKSFAISQGDAICKQLVADMKGLVDTFKKAHPTPTEADARDFLVNTLFARVDSGVGAMHRIGEPTKDRPEFDKAILALDKDLSALKEAAGTDPVKLVNNPIKLFDKSAQQFTDFGFKECGKNP